MSYVILRGKKWPWTIRPRSFHAALASDARANFPPSCRPQQTFPAATVCVFFSDSFIQMYVVPQRQPRTYPYHLFLPLFIFKKTNKEEKEEWAVPPVLLMGVVVSRP